MSAEQYLETNGDVREEFLRLVDGLPPFTLSVEQYELGIAGLPDEVSERFWLAFNELKKKGPPLSVNQASIEFFSAMARLKLVNISPD